MDTTETLKNESSKVPKEMHLSYLFEYNAQNFVRNFNQKLRVRVIHEFFHQHALFLFLFFSFIIFLQPDDESGFKL